MQFFSPSFSEVQPFTFPNSLPHKEWKEEATLFSSLSLLPPSYLSFPPFALAPSSGCPFKSVNLREKLFLAHSRRRYDCVGVQQHNRGVEEGGSSETRGGVLRTRLNALAPRRPATDHDQLRLLVARELFDALRELDVEGGEAVSLIVRRERDRDAVVDVGPLWVVLYGSSKVSGSWRVLYI